MPQPPSPITSRCKVRGAQNSSLRSPSAPTDLDLLPVVCLGLGLGLGLKLTGVRAWGWGRACGGTNHARRCGTVPLDTTLDTNEGTAHLCSPSARHHPTHNDSGEFLQHFGGVSWGAALDLGDGGSVIGQRWSAARLQRSTRRPPQSSPQVPPSCP